MSIEEYINYGVALYRTNNQKQTKQVDISLVLDEAVNLDFIDIVIVNERMG
jgi:hypothetical protein